jgi:serine/threonine protein kinase
MRIAEGTRVGLYEVTGLLGSGAMGNVYRARDPRLERDVAIKALPEGVASDPDALARFEREARFLAQLNHPNIGTIYGIEEVEGERLLVLELVPGETLEERLRHGPIAVEEVIGIGRQIAAALEAAHAAEIIHRDLKPSNVKVTPDGRVKLLDFGIARTTAKDSRHAESGALTITKSGQIVGTPQYMSPEQLYGEPVDRRADVWAFGCLMYEMLTGKYAFPGASFFEVADAIRIRDPDWSALPRRTPDALRRLLLRCMKKAPADRLADMGELRLELDDLASGGGAATRRRSTRLTWAVAAVAVAAIVVAALIATRGSRSRAVAEAP